MYSSTSTKGKALAQAIQDQLKTVFTNRGIKGRSNLYMLTKTHPPAVIVETFFVDSKADCELYDKTGEDAIGRLIAQGIAGKTIDVKPTNTQNTTAAKKGKYRVVVGSYAEKSNAEATQQKLKKAGFDSFLVFQEGI